MASGQVLGVDGLIKDVALGEQVEPGASPLQERAEAVGRSAPRVVFRRLAA
jgi:hypothetical protein